MRHGDLIEFGNAKEARRGRNEGLEVVFTLMALVAVAATTGTCKCCEGAADCPRTGDGVLSIGVSVGVGASSSSFDVDVSVRYNAVINASGPVQTAEFWHFATPRPGKSFSVCLSGSTSHEPIQGIKLQPRETSLMPSVCSPFDGSG